MWFVKRKQPDLVNTEAGKKKSFSMLPNAKTLIADDKQFENTIELYSVINKKVRQLSKHINALEIVNLFLSVVTSGSLWLLISESIPTTSLWFGTATSTLIALLTLYIHTFGLKKKHEAGLSLLNETAKLILDIGPSGMPNELFWKRFMTLQHRNNTLSLPYT